VTAEYIEGTGIVLALGAPNKTRDGRKLMCSIVVSEEFGLIRLYPLSVTENKDIRIWSRVAFRAFKSNKDSRHESFRLESISAIGKIESPQSKADILVSCELRSGTKDPIDYQNDMRRSISVVRVASRLGGAVVDRGEVQEHLETDEYDHFVWTQSEFPMKPYIIWSSIQGGNHQTHLVGQEIYMGLKHNASTPFRIMENANIGDPDYQHWLVLGNMKDRQRVWVCAHVHRLKKTNFDIRSSCLIDDGRREGWPYSTQEAANARHADRQKTFSFITNDI
jgi:hypothetical protein